MTQLNLAHKGIAEYITLLTDDAEEFENTGCCTSCGEIAYAVEPDAEGYECNHCGQHNVQGSLNILISYG
jgi:transposase